MVSAYKQFLSEIKHKIQPVYLFCGPEDFLIDLALQEVKKLILSHTQTGFNYRLFYGEETRATHIITEAETLPFLAGRRLIVVRNVTRLAASGIDEIVAYVKKPSEATCLILVEPAIKSNHKLYQAVVDFGMVVNFNSLKGRELDRWLEHRLARRGKRFEPGVARIIRDRVGEQLRELDRVVETLCSYVGRRRQIKISDVEEAVGQTYLLNIFKLVDAVGAKRPDIALEILQQLRLQRITETHCLSMLARQWRQIKECRLAQEKGYSDEEILARLNVSSYILQKIMKQACNFKIAELKDGFKFLLEADIKIKTGQLKPWLVLEWLVLKLCSVSS